MLPSWPVHSYCIKTDDFISSSHLYSQGLAKASNAQMYAYGSVPKPQCAWLPTFDPGFNRSPPRHIRARPAAANGTVVNGPAPVWDPEFVEI